jgi:hypothetical protein
VARQRAGKEKWREITWTLMRGRARHISLRHEAMNKEPFCSVSGNRVQAHKENKRASSTDPALGYVSARLLNPDTVGDVPVKPWTIFTTILEP